MIDIVAYPHSINTLNPGTDDDVRTPDKLIDGENDDIDWVNISFYLRSIEYLLYSIDQHLCRWLNYGIMLKQQIVVWENLLYVYFSNLNFQRNDYLFD